MSKQTLSFQAEVAQLLHLVTHSLYSNPEIFVRELISNASDACDKLRFEALDKPALYEDAPNLEVRVSFDKDAKTLTIADNGIGMSAQEAIEHLGTIAKSGTKDFMGRLTGDQKQMRSSSASSAWVYSGFIVADKITVESRRAGLPPSRACAGSAPAPATSRSSRSTARRAAPASSCTSRTMPRIPERLEAQERHRQILRPHQPAHPDGKGRGKDGEDPSNENGSRQPGAWSRPASGSRQQGQRPVDAPQEGRHRRAVPGLLQDHQPRPRQTPLTWAHNRVEGNTEYTQLPTCPATRRMDLWDRDKKAGVKLYVKRVFIMDDAEALLPPATCGFVKGVVDSADLPLNVSRELLQRAATKRAIREGIAMLSRARCPRRRPRTDRS